MKECIAAALILVAVIILCVSTTSYTANFCNELSTLTYNSIDAAKNENWELSERNISIAKELFDNKASKMKMFCEHQDIAEILGSMDKLHEAILLKNIDVAVNEGETIQMILKKLSEYDNLSLDNIL